MNTLTTDTVRSLTATGLRLLAEAIVFYIDSLEFMPDSGLYGDPQASLHVVALELNRRHGAASEQEVYEVPNAVDTIRFFQFDDDREISTLDLARAYGLLIDKGAGDDWAAIAPDEHSCQWALETLHDMARDEEIQRNHPTASVAVCPF